MGEQLKLKKQDNLERSFLIDRKAIDEDNRSIELAFSSEAPVSRWEGEEILDHSPESVRLGRLRDGGAVLVDHDPSDHIGTVDRVSIDDDRRGRVTVRLGKSERATEIWNDINDGIRKHVSVGYRVHKAVVEERDEDGDLVSYRVTDWEPHEVSFVSIPADASVGIGRSEDVAEPLQINEKTQVKTMPEVKEVVETPAVDVEAITADARTAELERIREIEAQGERFDLGEDARQFIKDGKTADEFRSHTLDALEERSKMNIQTQAAIQSTTTAPGSVSHIGLTEGESKRYSLMNAIRAAVKGDWSGAEFERECSVAVADAYGKEARGFYLPAEVMERVQTVGSATKGGDLVATDHLAGSFIDSLRAQSTIGQLGATFLTGLVGDVDIPRKNGSASFQWLSEDGDVSDTDLLLGHVPMSPKTVAGSVAMSRRLLKQSAPSIEQLVLQDLIDGAALAIDAAAYAGTGSSNQPLGIINQTGINSVTFVDPANPTYEEMVALETALANQNALMGSLQYVTTPGIRGALKTARKDDGSGLFVLENNMANGYGVISTTNIPTDTMLFGNFSDLIVGMWGVLDINPDTAAKAASGGLVLRVFQDIDIAVRHAKSFAVSASA
jgi:HK97 family phage major capsid protein/HK97 family phage prohead protease